MALAGFISKIVQSITRTTFQFNKTLDVLMDRLKDGCPTTPELKSLINQKNQINGAIQQIQQKIITLNKVAAGSEIAADALSKGKTLIKQIPIPSSVPPGVGLPLSIMNNFSDALDNLGTLIDKEKASLDSIPEALDLISKDVGEVITKLNEFNVAINICAEKDPNLNEDDLIDAAKLIDTNFVEVLTNEDLEKLLNEPPGLLYGDYYLRLNYINSEFSFDKKQIIAQNKKSVPPPGEFYNENAAIEELFGDESFSSSNVVLVDEMKWTIDIKDLIFPPPPPTEDPLKAIYKQGQITLLMAIYQASKEEAEELYELAWHHSQNRGISNSNYDKLVEDAFNNSRTILEQAVATIGDKWKDGYIILDSTIKNLFLGGIEDESEQKSYISLIKKQASDLRNLANEVGGNFNSHRKIWNNEDDFEHTAKLYSYSSRLRITSNNDLDISPDLGPFENLRPEIKRRTRANQSIFEEANYLSLQNPKISFNDPLTSFFRVKGYGYNTPIINGLHIVGDSNTPITFNEVEELWELEKDLQYDWFYNNIIPNVDPMETANGVFTHFANGDDGNFLAYSKTQLFLKLRTAMGSNWYNSKASETSELSFWYLQNVNSQITNDYNDPNKNLDSSDRWYFEFGKNGLHIPTGS